MGVGVCGQAVATEGGQRFGRRRRLTARLCLNGTSRAKFENLPTLARDRDPARHRDRLRPEPRRGARPVWEAGLSQFIMVNGDLTLENCHILHTGIEKDHSATQT